LQDGARGVGANEIGVAAPELRSQLVRHYCVRWQHADNQEVRGQAQ
jgi:hypothetical protein